MSLTQAQKKALKWLQERGGDAAVARTTAGGRYILAQGDTGPFTVATCRALVSLGLAEYVDVGGRKAARFRLTEAGAKDTTP